MHITLAIYSTWLFSYDLYASQKQHMDEMKAINLALKAQREALEELKIESEELYQAAIKPDPSVFPFSHEGPSYTPPMPKYDAPDGKYNDITKVYNQAWIFCWCVSSSPILHVVLVRMEHPILDKLR